MNDDKVSMGIRQVNVKDVRVGLWKIITWTKKFGKGRQKWEKAYVENESLLQKFKTLNKTRFSCKIIMFEKNLEFKKTIFLYYGK